MEVEQVQASPENKYLTFIKTHQWKLFGLTLVFLLVSISANAYFLLTKEKKSSTSINSWHACLRAEGSTIHSTTPVLCVTKSGEHFVQSFLKNLEDTAEGQAIGYTPSSPSPNPSILPTPSESPEFTPGWQSEPEKLYFSDALANDILSSQKVSFSKENIDDEISLSLNKDSNGGYLPSSEVIVSVKNNTEKRIRTTSAILYFFYKNEWRSIRFGQPCGDTVPAADLSNYLNPNERKELLSWDQTVFSCVDTTRTKQIQLPHGKYKVGISTYDGNKIYTEEFNIWEVLAN